jgi:hypothetical protein
MVATSNLKLLQKSLAIKEKDIEAFKYLFENNFFVKAENGKMVYPSKRKIDESILSFKAKRKKLLKEQLKWMKMLFLAKNAKLMNEFKKFFTVLYWKHLSKYLTNQEYKEAFQSVNMPLHLISSKKHRKMIEAFIKNKDYREKLVMTVNHGLVYRKDKKLGKHFDKVQEHRFDTAKRHLDNLEKQLKHIDRTIKALAVVRNYSVK